MENATGPSAASGGSSPLRINVPPISIREVQSALLEEQPEYRRLFEEEVQVAHQGALVFRELVARAQNLSITRDTLVLQVCAKLLGDIKALETENDRLRANSQHQHQPGSAYRAAVLDVTGVGGGAGGAAGHRSPELRLSEQLEAERRRSAELQARVTAVEQNTQARIGECRQHAAEELSSERSRRQAMEQELDSLRRKLGDMAERAKQLEKQCDGMRSQMQQREQQQLKAAQVSVQLLEQAQQQLSRTQTEVADLRAQLQRRTEEARLAKEEAQLAKEEVQRLKALGSTQQQPHQQQPHQQQQQQPQQQQQQQLRGPGHWSPAGLGVGGGADVEATNGFSGPTASSRPRPPAPAVGGMGNRASSPMGPPPMMQVNAGPKRQRVDEPLGAHADVGGQALSIDPQQQQQQPVASGGGDGANASPPVTGASPAVKDGAYDGAY